MKIKAFRLSPFFFDLKEDNAKHNNQRIGYELDDTRTLRGRRTAGATIYPVS